MRYDSRLFSQWRGSCCDHLTFSSVLDRKRKSNIHSNSRGSSSSSSSSSVMQFALMPRRWRSSRRRRARCRPAASSTTACLLAWSTINVPEVGKSLRIMMPDTDYRHRRRDPTLRPCRRRNCKYCRAGGQAARRGWSTETGWPCGFVGGRAGVLEGNWTSSERNVISYVLASRGTSGQLTLVSGVTTDADHANTKPLPCYALRLHTSCPVVRLFNAAS